MRPSDTHRAGSDIAVIGIKPDSPHGEEGEDHEHGEEEDGRNPDIKTLLRDAHEAANSDDADGFVSSMHAAIKAGVEKFMQTENEDDDDHVEKKDN